MKNYKREFFFSKHYRQDKEIDAELAIDCIHTGTKALDGEPNKFKSTKQLRRGRLVVVYRELENCVFIITAFWNRRGLK